MGSDGVKQSTIDRVGNRYNTPAALFKEGGEEGGVDAFGTKFIFLSTRPDNLALSRIILSVRRQDEARKGAEAGQAVDMLTALQERSEGRVQAVCWDGAMRGVHAAALLDQGILPVRRHHKGTKPRRYIDPVDGANLWTVTGGLVERQLNVDGTPRDTPCPILKREKRPRRDGTYRWYNVYTVPSTGEVIRVPLHQSDADTARRYNRCENLQPFAPGSPEYNKLSGYRSDSESVHASLDRTLHERRMIAFRRDTQDLVMLSFVLAQNAASRFQYARRVTALQLVA